jgi:surface protein
MAPLSRRERALAHLRSAIRYERKGLPKKAVAHFGRAMHYGALKDLPDEVIQMIIERALKDEISMYRSLLLTNKLFISILPHARVLPANFFLTEPVDVIRKNPVFVFFWRSIANLLPLNFWKVPAQRHDSKSTELLIAVTQLITRIIAEWYHFCPNLFHPMVKILHDTPVSDPKHQFALAKLESFMAHLNKGPCAECAILQKEAPEGPEETEESEEAEETESPIEQIRRIINKEFRPAEIGENIGVLVDKYFKDPKSPDLEKYGHLCVWNTGSVQNMANVFRDNLWKNGEWDVRLWDTRSVTFMDRAFASNTTGQFNGVEHWDTINVKSMLSMFYQAQSFNQDIGKWNTGNVRNMSYMLYGARLFNQDIGTWNTGNVENMVCMFDNAWLFNQDISKWDTRKVKHNSDIFEGATALMDEYKPVFMHLAPSQKATIFGK